jgi:membrane protein implicated in regulation of membrane protease activity
VSSIGIPGIILLLVLALFVILIVIAVSGLKRGVSGGGKQKKIAELEQRIERLEQDAKERS